MKIKLIKDHLLGKAGEVVNADNSRANYLIRCGAAIEYSDPKPGKPSNKKKVQAKKKTTTKNKKDGKS